MLDMGFEPQIRKLMLDIRPGLSYNYNYSKGLKSNLVWTVNLLFGFQQFGYHAGSEI